MRALTIHAPWAWGICYLGKDIENRSRPFPAKLLGQDICIHAGSERHWKLKKMAEVVRAASPMTGKHLENFQRVFCAGPERYAMERTRFCSAIVAVVRIDKYEAPRLLTTYGAPGWNVSDFMEGWRRYDCWGWRLSNIRVIEPVPYRRGALGLWTVPADVEAIVQERLLKAEVVG